MTIIAFSGCEFLQKLDFTVNFIGDLLSVEKLKHNVHLQELYLTGNPCTEYEGYRDFVIASLPQLVTLDGKEITKSERISATQQLETLRKEITQQQQKYALKREREKEAFKEKQSKKENSKRRQPGYDGRWYTDPNAHLAKGHEEAHHTKEGEGQGEEGEEARSQEGEEAKGQEGVEAKGQEGEGEEGSEARREEGNEARSQEGEEAKGQEGEGEEESDDEAEAYTPEYRVRQHNIMMKKKMEQAKEPE